MKILIILLTCFSCGFATVPHYIKPCARTDPKFTECAIKHANENMKELVKGDRKHDIPQLDPLIIDEMRVDANGFHIVDRNLEITGFKNLVVTHLHYDFKTHDYRIKFTAPRFQMLANYEVSGKILFLPINGKGRVNCTGIDFQVDVKGKYLFENINGTKYIYSDKPEMDMKVKRMYLKFTNLFNGNKLLEDQMNTFLDENWRGVYDELAKPGVDVLGEILIGIINKIHRTAPYDELFPETIP